MPTKTWVVGEEVLAADLNSYIQKQVVPTFATVAARDAAMPAPTAGALAYTSTERVLWCYRDSPGGTGGGGQTTAPTIAAWRAINHPMLGTHQYPDFSVDNFTATTPTLWATSGALPTMPFDVVQRLSISGYAEANGTALSEVGFQFYAGAAAGAAFGFKVGATHPAANKPFSWALAAARTVPGGGDLAWRLASQINVGNTFLRGQCSMYLAPANAAR